MKVLLVAVFFVTWSAFAEVPEVSRYVAEGACSEEFTLGQDYFFDKVECLNKKWLLKQESYLTDNERGCVINGFVLTHEYLNASHCSNIQLIRSRGEGFYLSSDDFICLENFEVIDEEPDSVTKLCGFINLD